MLAYSLRIKFKSSECLQEKAKSTFLSVSQYTKNKTKQDNDA